MKNLLKNIVMFALLICISISCVSCGEKKQSAEKIELTTAVLGDVEFENSEETEIERDGDTYTISGTIDAMSDSQKIAFGDDDVTHIVALKFTFDTERTISSFKIEGNKIKVYADEDSDENFAGSLTDLLDSSDGEDAYANLILSASTEEYLLTTTYTDETVSTITLKITATLATAEAE